MERRVGVGGLAGGWIICTALWVSGCVELKPRTPRDGSADVAADAPPPDQPDAAATDLGPDIASQDRVDPSDQPDASVTDAFDAPAEDRAAPTDALDVPIDVPAAPDVPDVPAAPDVPDVLDAPDVPAADVGGDRSSPNDVPDVLSGPFPSTGQEGPFPPIGHGTEIVLAPRVHNFTTVNIPVGLVVRAAVGTGVLELRATGDVTINGTIDVSGGAGGSAALGMRLVARGGDTANPHGPRPTTASCTASDERGLGGEGTPGSGAGCGQGGRFGGGNSGPPDGNNGGGGGGGFGGGGGGRAQWSASHTEAQWGGIGGGEGEAGIGGRGMILASGGGSGMLGGPLAAYAGGAPVDAMGCLLGSAGGGSIGTPAAEDPAVRTLFRAGSGGGGGGGWTNGTLLAFGGGGGGGGGAVRISSPTRIVIGVSGAVRANGGAGGGNGVMAAQMHAGGAGGGGSGGVVYLSAPRVQILGSVSAVGGRGGELRATCGVNRGGGGGLGRVRLSVDPAQCTVSGAVNPPVRSGCTVTADGGAPIDAEADGGVAGGAEAFVGAWPN